jgi:nifR3 family TIM-barrel protein
LKIGDIELANRVLLAPMSGITDAPFRRLASRLGAGLVVSEMTASDDLVNGKPMSRLRCEATGIGPHVVQLAGCQAHWMEEGARIAEAAGADIIDINMGCPARHVTGGQSGSALMRDLVLAVKLVEATVNAVKVPVTLKMRLGWDERSLNAPELARRAEGAGVQMVTVHGRTRCQFYKGEADWSAVRAVKEAGTIPLVVNGDVTSFDEAVSALAEAGADAVLKKPFEASVVLETIRPLIDKSRFARGLFAEDPPVDAAPPVQTTGPIPPPQIDPDRVRAAVTVAQDRTKPALVKEITEKVLIPLAHCSPHA